MPLCELLLNLQHISSISNTTSHQHITTPSYSTTHLLDLTHPDILFKSHHHAYPNFLQEHTQEDDWQAPLQVSLLILRSPDGLPLIVSSRQPKPSSTEEEDNAVLDSITFEPTLKKTNDEDDDKTSNEEDKDGRAAEKDGRKADKDKDNDSKEGKKSARWLSTIMGAGK